MGGLKSDHVFWIPVNGTSKRLCCTTKLGRVRVNYPLCPPSSSALCLHSVFEFFHDDGLVFQPHPFIFTSAARLQSRTRRQLQVLRAARAGGSGDPGEGLFVGRGQVDHEEDAVRHVLIGAGAGELGLPPTAPNGGQQLAVPLRVLQVLQGDHVGQSQLAVQAEASPAAPQQEAEGTDEEEEEGDGCYGDVGGSGTDDGLA